MNNDPQTMNSKQSTSHILMIRPVKFGFNHETAESNAFQKLDADTKNAQEQALAEFDGMVNLLRGNGVDVTVIDDNADSYTPDSIFPNNWVSFHDNGDVFLYPMKAENRRLERRADVITRLEKCFTVKNVNDLSHFENENRYLEGTGSMVLDRKNKIVYACLSPRTDRAVLNSFCDMTGYKSVFFNAVDGQNRAIYHTNVLMCIGNEFAVVCLDSIPNLKEKTLVIESIKSTKKELIEISLPQMNQFAGNMLQLTNESRESLIVMSKSAHDSLFEDQKVNLRKYGRLIYPNINTIETIGGGSTRCMMAEVFLPLVAIQ